MLYVTLILAALLVRIHGSVTGYIEPPDSSRFLEILRTNFKNEGDDVVSPYFAAAGFKLLNEPVPENFVKQNCAHLKQHFKPASPPEFAFHALSTWSLLACPGKAYTDETVISLKAAIENEKSAVSDVRFAVETLKLIGQTIPNPTKIAQQLQERLKEDDSLLSVGHALHAAATLGPAGKFAAEKTEEIVAQADEIDGRMLQWEGGLTTTSLILTGLLRLPNAKPLTQLQLDKFTTYLLTRKTVQSPKGVFALLQAASALSDSTVSVTIIGPAHVTTEKPDLTVRISDLFGRPLKSIPSPIFAQSATRVADDVVVLSKQPLSPGGRPAEYVLPLRSEPGQYRVGLVVGTHSSALTVRVLGPVTLNWLEIGVGDADSTSAPRLTKLQYPSKLPTTLQSDANHQLIARISLNRIVHQAFLRLSSGKKEIVFVAEPDANQLYKLDVNLASELEHSGTYDLEVIIGDSAITNPIRWTVGVLEAKLPAQPPTPVKVRAAKPEIEHLFRQAEKRPPQTVSVLFTALAAAPLVLLLALWCKLGVNFGNFSLRAVPFHIGLGSILGLFTMFWLKLDMFTTCAWLIPLAAFTFLTGHRLLSRIASQKKSDK